MHTFGKIFAILVLPASLVAATPPPITRVCHKVPAQAANGVVFGTVVAGHSYGYHASGTVGFQYDNVRQSDADGNNDAGPGLAGLKGGPCPDLRLLSLVGRIDGSHCVQLGRRGSFVAPASGNLVLYFNDNIFGDNHGAFAVCVEDLGPSSPTVEQPGPPAVPPPAVPPLPAPTVAVPALPPSPRQIVVRGIRYDGQLSDSDARFGVDLDLEMSGPGEATLPLFSGEVAVLTTALPANLRLTRAGNQFNLVVARAGRYRFKLDLVAKINRQEPWNLVTFTGPAAAIGAVSAQAAGAGLDLQLLTGTLQEAVTKDGVTRVRGFLGPDRVVSLRWQSKAAEVTRQALLTCETSAVIQVTPTVLKYATNFRYEILQGSPARLVIRLPAGQALTKLQGEGVRDWQIKREDGQQTLAIEFIKPLERAYALTLLTEQSVETATATVQVVPPQPQDVERESGSVAVSAEDVLVETESASGLRQVNATGGALAAWQFYARPFTLALRLRRIEPVLSVADRVTVRVEEARLLVVHGLTLTVEKAGIYTLELTPQPGFVVADVRGEGIEDWKSSGGKLTVSFAARALGTRQLEVQLEQALKSKFPEQIVIQALRVTGAAKGTAQIGAAAAAGLQIKTVAQGLAGLREVPINLLANRTDETLAYTADQPDWKLTLSAERLEPRLTADVFNLITIGDGLLGGSATIRFAIINQGVQEFHVKVPALWKNVEFTGPNIRRKELQGDTWVIGLQEKVWGGYTLVVTYDYQFDPHKATLPIGGIHPDGVERETGSIAVTSAANLELTTQPNGDNIRRVDEAELAASDRALISRPVLMAYKYQGPAYGLAVDVTRFDEVRVLDAVADRTQLTTVLTDAGQMLTQASFMVKNNDRQFQTFTLPAGADFWACYVSGEPTKPEKNGGKLLVPLPRRANRDEAFPVDIVYAQKIGSLKSLAPRRLDLAAPVTDMQTTYAEWELYVPPTHLLENFGGNMIVARGTTYGLADAWRVFLRFYDALYQQAKELTVLFVLVAGALAFLVVAIRRGWRGALAVLVLLVVLALFAALLLPALSSARGKARTANSISNLKQIGLALDMFAEQHGGQLPATLDQIKGMTGSEKVFYDVNSGQRFEYVGAGRKWQEGGGNEMLAFSPVDLSGRTVLFSDGHVQWMSSAQFDESLGRMAEVHTNLDGGLVGGNREDKELAEKRPGTGGAGRPVPPAAMLAPAPAAAPGDLSAIRNGLGVGRGMVVTKPAPAPLVSGIRPIRIEIPRTGVRFVFTKVLNVGKEPLAVRAVALDQQAVNAVRGLAEVLAFVAGLVLLVWQFRRPAPNSVLVTLGLALVIGSVGNWLLATRLLGGALIVGAPVVALAVVVWVVRKCWKREERRAKSDNGEDGNGGGGTAESGSPGAPSTGSGPSGSPASTEGPVAPPVVVAIALLLLGAGAARAGDTVSILSADYVGSVRSVDGPAAGRVAQFEATFAVESPEKNQTLRLFGPDVAVEEFAPAAKAGGWLSFFGQATDQRLVRDGQNIAVFLPQKGKATVRLRFLVKLGGDVAKRQIVFGIPAALTSRVALTLDETDTTVEAPLAISLKSAPSGAQTLVTAVFGAADRVELTWTPRMKRAAETAATVFCQNLSQVTVSGGAVDVRSVLDYQVTQGELRQLQVKLPAGQRLMRVEGDGIRTWKLDGQTVTVELIKGVTPAYRLTVETEMPAVNSLVVQVPHAINVQRETGLVGLRASEELSLTVTGQEGLQKVDVEEFGRALPAPAAAPVSLAYRFLKPEFALAVAVEPVQPQIEAVVHNVVRVGTDQIGVRATVDYTIKRAGVFGLRLALPAEYRLERVSGENISQWVEKPGDSRLLEVTLNRRTMGSYLLTVDLARSLAALPPSVAIVGVQPLDTQKLTGFVAAGSEEGVQIKTESFTGLTEVPAATVGNVTGPGGTTLAFKFIPTETSGRQPGWKLSVATEKIESWVRAEVMNLITLTETLASGRSQVRYEIQNAPTKQLRVRVPAAFTNVEVTGPNIRRQDEDEAKGEWRIELQNKVRGTYTLTVTWEQPWNVKDGSLELMGPEAVGVERETGVLAIVAPPRLKLEPKNPTPDLRELDVRDLPDWARLPADTGAVLTYRYLRPGYKLTLAAQRFEEAEVLQALVDSVRLTTVVAEDGQMMTEMKLAVRNNGRQYLEVVLPEGAEVWSAFVAGQPVRPSNRAGKLLLPMERSSGGDAVAVEVTYVGSGAFPASHGPVALTSPAFDVPLKNAHWELYLPPDYQYGDFAGTMKPEIAATAVVAAPAAVAHFGLSEYARAETEQKELRDADVASSLSNARSRLAGGKVSDAWQFLSRAKTKVATDDIRANEDLKRLEKDVRREQSRSLVQAQQSFVADNFEGQQPNAAPAPARQVGASSDLMQYAEQAAEQQVVKVAQSQDIAAARTLPLRVNLPKRGVHYSVGQVLQTEVGQPMSVRFTASNNQATNWPVRLGLGVLGLVVLWWVVSMTVARRKE